VRGRHGGALLEVLVATTVLAVGAAAALSVVRESVAAVHATRVADEEMRRAVAFLDAVSVWGRTDLDQRLGDRAQGDWRLRIARPHPELYTVTLTDSTRTRVLLSTALHRPAEAP
jgi:type II secretory pathway pseudopilin PulG